jgi:hypothetical protein
VPFESNAQSSFYALKVGAEACHQSGLLVAKPVDRGLPNSMNSLFATPDAFNSAARAAATPIPALAAAVSASRMCRPS